MTTTTLLHGLAIAVAGGLGLAAGYGLACWRHAARLTRSAEHVTALRARIGELLAALTAIPDTATEHRARVAAHHAEQVARIDSYYLAMRPSRRAGGLGRNKVA